MKFNTEVEKFAHQHCGISSLKLHDYKKHVSGLLLPNNYIVPTIVEEREINMTTIDVFSRLMKDGVLHVCSDIHSEMSCIINAQLLFMHQALDRELKMYLSTRGGECNAGLSIFDTMQQIVSYGTNLSVTVTGMAASMGSIILQGGTKGMRQCLPHSRVMIHQPLGGAQGQVSDMKISLKEIERIELELYTILANASGKTIEQISIDCNRDNFMNPEEAKTYGLIDSILYP